MLNAKNNTVLVTIIAKGMYLKGDIQTISDVRIEGVVEGTIVTTGKVFIEKGASITGELTAKTVELNGKFRGNILADNQVVIGEFSDFEGGLFCESIEIRKGAKFSGNLQAHNERAFNAPDLNSKKMDGQFPHSQDDQSSGNNPEKFELNESGNIAGSLGSSTDRIW